MFQRNKKRKPFLPPEVVESILNWFKAAVPEPTGKNLQTQIGVHFEEVGEMFEAILDGMDENAPTDHEVHIAGTMSEVCDTAERIKTGELVLDLNKIDRQALLDACCDQIVTAIGTAYYAGFDIVGALKEVDASNWSKFDEEGKPIFDANLKITKGPNYFKPTLAKFL